MNMIKENDKTNQKLKNLQKIVLTKKLHKSQKKPNLQTFISAVNNPVKVSRQTCLKKPKKQARLKLT